MNSSRFPVLLALLAVVIASGCRADESEGQTNPEDSDYTDSVIEAIGVVYAGPDQPVKTVAETRAAMQHIVDSINNLEQEKGPQPELHQTKSDMQNYLDLCKYEFDTCDARLDKLNNLKWEYTVGEASNLGRYFTECYVQQMESCVNEAMDRKSDEFARARAEREVNKAVADGRLGNEMLAKIRTEAADLAHARREFDKAKEETVARAVKQALTEMEENNKNVVTPQEGEKATEKKNKTRKSVLTKFLNMKPKCLGNKCR